MTKTFEMLVTALILAAMYCSLPLRNFHPLGGSQAVRNSAESQVVLVADGTDPIPIRR